MRESSRNGLVVAGTVDHADSLRHIRKLVADALLRADESDEHVLGARLDECLFFVDRRIDEIVRTATA